MNTNFDTYNDLRPSSEVFDGRKSSSDYDKYGVEMQGQMDYPVSERKSKSRFQQFDEPHPEEHKPDEHKPEQTHQMLDEVKKLEDEIRKLEQAERASAAAKPPSTNTTIKANISFPLKWKQYRNLSEVDTMDLKYEVSGKDTLTVQIIFFIIFPSLLLILFLYLAITLYWTKYVTPRDIMERENGPKRPQRKKDRDRGNGTDDDFGISDYDTDEADEVPEPRTEQTMTLQTEKQSAKGENLEDNGCY
ncbi:LOW QUALITY PROTEIN: hypothetical protein RvY_07659 [Ramazzottius varieornatus]|uniref:Uncharacterized protein n=1 Tax=Ramazzottius varieornatus TaxID=947166 RepID=A0A1D1V2Z7_RAMVA|nr:LOW QUALITY PROTEIN: hypothetical protein RvY_07659 [Ramazzottius varieornatus]